MILLALQSDETGVLRFVIGVLQDVSQRREAERVKDEFLSVVGHELRTPLTSIRGSLGLLEGGVLGELPEEAGRMVALAVANTDRLMRLINDILDIERLGAGHVEIERGPIPAAYLVSQAMQVIQSAAEEAGVTLSAEVADPTVSADADRIVQALVNLLGNAVKFSSRGGVVVVSVRAEGEPAKGEHAEDKQAESVCAENAPAESEPAKGEHAGSEHALFSVRDTGRGIPADQLETIFERFRSARSPS